MPNFVEIFQNYPELFIQKNSFKLSYTENPTDDLAVDRLINRKNNFYRDIKVQQNGLKYKTFIINDPLLPFYPKDVLDSFFNFMLYLGFNEGYFKIYLCKQGKLKLLNIPIQHYNLEGIVYHSPVSYELQMLLEENSLTSDNILLISPGDINLEGKDKGKLEFVNKKLVMDLDILSKYLETNNSASLLEYLQELDFTIKLFYTSKKKLPKNTVEFVRGLSKKKSNIQKHFNLEIESTNDSKIFRRYISDLLFSEKNSNFKNDLAIIKIYVLDSISLADLLWLLSFDIQLLQLFLQKKYITAKQLYPGPQHTGLILHDITFTIQKLDTQMSFKLFQAYGKKLLLEDSKVKKAYEANWAENTTFKSMTINVGSLLNASHCQLYSSICEGFDEIVICNFRSNDILTQDEIINFFPNSINVRYFDKLGRPIVEYIGKKGYEQEIANSTHHIEPLKKIKDEIKKLKENIIDDQIQNSKKNEFYIAQDGLLGEERKFGRNFSPNTPVYYYKAFKTWQSTHFSSKLSLDQFNEKIFTKEGNNILLKFRNKQQIDDYLDYVYSFAKDNRHELLFISASEKMTCSDENIILSEDGTGIIKQKPCGEVFDTLTKQYTKPLILIIDYSDFKAQDIVRCNSAIDMPVENRNIDGVKIPHNTIIIGLIDINHNYKGEDFFSRFTLHAPIFQMENISAELKNRTKNLKKEILDFDVAREVAQKENFFLIYNYELKDWESSLIGSWKLNYKELILDPGSLLNVIRQISIKKIKNASIIINNPPLDDKRFGHILRQLIVYKKTCLFGLTITIPDNTSFQFSDGLKVFDFSNISYSDYSHIKPDYILTASNRRYLFEDIELNDGGFMKNTQGFLDKTPKNDIILYIPFTFDKLIWIDLLSKLESYKKNISIALHPSVSVPNEIFTNELYSKLNQSRYQGAQEIQSETNNNLESLIFTKTNFVILSDSIEKTAQDLIKNNNIDYSIPISEIMVHQLFGSIEPISTQFPLRFRKKMTFFTEKLRENKRILLYGVFSSEILENIVTFFHKHSLLCSDKDNQAQIILLADISQQNCFQFTKNILFYRQNNNTITNSKIVNINNNNQRKLQCLEQLNDYPCIAIIGPTSVGKSTFINSLQSDINLKVFIGLDSLREWTKAISNTSIKYNILVVDEYNLTNSDFSVFNNIYTSSPSIYVDNNYFYLTNKHKVIFVGNSIEYGGMRKQPRLFDIQNIPILKFEAMDIENLYYYLLQKYSKGESLKKYFVTLLKIYAYVQKLTAGASTKVSTRELEMMILIMLVLDKYKRFSKKTLIYQPEIPAICAYLVLANILNKSQKSKFISCLESNMQFDINLVEDSIMFPNKNYKENSNFILVKSRFLAYNQLLAFIEVRKLKIEESQHLNSLIGLNAIKIEGMPGLGKSQFVKSVLKNEAFVPASKFSFSEYIFISANSKPKEQEKMLLQAFYSGLIVVIEEANTADLNERLINTLLMGTDLSGAPSPKKGFALIITQNPIQMGGREPYSQALQRRMLHVDFPDYRDDEYKSIIDKKYNLNINEAEYLIEIFIKHRDYALRQKYRPTPTTRELFNEAHRISLKNNKYINFDSSFFLAFDVDDHWKNLFPEKKMQGRMYGKLSTTEVITPEFDFEYIEYTNDYEIKTVKLPKHLFSVNEPQVKNRTWMINISAHGLVQVDSRYFSVQYFKNTKMYDFPYKIDKFVENIKEAIGENNTYNIGFYLWACGSFTVAFRMMEELQKNYFKNCFTVTYGGDNKTVFNKAGIDLKSERIIKKDYPDGTNHKFSKNPFEGVIDQQKWSNKDNKLAVFCGYEGDLQILPYSLFKDSFMSRSSNGFTLMKNTITPVGILKRIIRLMPNIKHSEYTKKYLNKFILWNDIIPIYNKIAINYVDKMFKMLIYHDPPRINQEQFLNQYVPRNLNYVGFSYNDLLKKVQTMYTPSFFWRDGNCLIEDDEIEKLQGIFSSSNPIKYLHDYLNEENFDTHTIKYGFKKLNELLKDWFIEVEYEHGNY
ncbi:hypothetical protein EDC55_102114 [Allofrancisella inopinata]|uniref:Uncharacterized protein n=1 Tax=Allofrancisella inopinata TaxID=1085647 RepID=A0AAE6YHP7_9GAMM|nr:hypothetical protein [Allofrancisella inopinata]QIV96005.1 hypothetical protein E4K63_03830 [Allofrancisella inopinata]TDT74428.1 hypothetical protein EDC55_102114 [Allofrancisella inopinata]